MPLGAARPRSMTTTDLIGEYIASARSGDWERAFGFFADDIRIRIPGRSALAGEHTGRAVARDYIERARALSSEHSACDVAPIWSGRAR